MNKLSRGVCPCERRMAPLTHDLVGLILPAFAHGSHLDDNGKTIDNDLEIKNFFDTKVPNLCPTKILNV